MQGNGLQPNSDGLQQRRNGLQPSSKIQDVFEHFMPKVLESGGHSLAFLLLEGSTLPAHRILPGTSRWPVRRAFLEEWCWAFLGGILVKKPNLWTGFAPWQSILQHGTDFAAAPFARVLSFYTNDLFCLALLNEFQMARQERRICSAWHRQ